jgi:hypothetical protein
MIVRDFAIMMPTQIQSVTSWRRLDAPTLLHATTMHMFKQTMETVHTLTPFLIAQATAIMILTAMEFVTHLKHQVAQILLHAITTAY